MIWYSVAASAYLLVGLLYAAWRMTTSRHWPEQVRHLAQSSRAFWTFVFAANWLLWPLDVLAILAHAAKVTFRHRAQLRAHLCGYWPQLAQAMNVINVWRAVREQLATVLAAHDFLHLDNEVRELAEHLQRRGLLPPDLTVTERTWPPVLETQNHCVKCGRQPTHLIITLEGSMCDRCAPRIEPVKPPSPVPPACHGCGRPFDLPRITKDSRILCGECFKVHVLKQG